MSFDIQGTIRARLESTRNVAALPVATPGPTPLVATSAPQANSRTEDDMQEQAESPERNIVAKGGAKGRGGKGKKAATQKKPARSTSTADMEEQGESPELKVVAKSSAKGKGGKGKRKTGASTTKSAADTEEQAESSEGHIVTKSGTKNKGGKGKAASTGKGKSGKGQQIQNEPEKLSEEEDEEDGEEEHDPDAEDEEVEKPSVKPSEHAVSEPEAKQVLKKPSQPTKKEASSSKITVRKRPASKKDHADAAVKRRKGKGETKKETWMVHGWEASMLKKTMCFRYQMFQSLKQVVTVKRVMTQNPGSTRSHYETILASPTLRFRYQSSQIHIGALIINTDLQRV